MGKHNFSMRCAVKTTFITTGVIAAGLVVCLSIMAPAEAAAPQQLLPVAALQTDSREGESEENRERASVLVDAAASDGAYLILLPELMPSGYITEKSLWDMAEPSDGATVQWMREQARERQVWLGTTFIEASGENFFNTFVLVDPGGNIAGRVRKQWLPGHEAFFTKGYDGSHIIETELGKIGVAICYEVTLCEVIQLMHRESVDLVLMPTADPVPEFDADKEPEDWDHNLEETALLYADALGVPVILANQGGIWQTSLPGPLPDQNSIFRGQSSIADSDGTLLDSLGQQEGYIVVDVVLDPTLKTAVPPECIGQYSKEMPLSSTVYQFFVERAGRLYYSLSRERRQKACEISGECGE